MQRLFTIRSFFHIADYDLWECTIEALCATGQYGIKCLSEWLLLLYAIFTKPAVVELVESSCNWDRAYFGIKVIIMPFQPHALLPRLTIQILLLSSCSCVKLWLLLYSFLTIDRLDPSFSFSLTLIYYLPTYRGPGIAYKRRCAHLRCRKPVIW